jgi:hypothetical protein
VVAACRDHALAVRAQDAFISNRFRVYTSDDVVGVEMGGALKNVVALAVGMCDGLGLGDNSRAALITRGLAEMMRLGAAYGASPATFAGLSGIGDLIVTCTSRLSRNHTVGERLGKGETLEQIMGSMKQVAEGVTNCVTARALALKKNIEAPVVSEVHAILYEGRRADEVLDLGIEPLTPAQLAHATARAIRKMPVHALEAAVVSMAMLGEGLVDADAGRALIRQHLATIGEALEANDRDVIGDAHGKPVVNLDQGNG